LCFVSPDFTFDSQNTVLTNLVPNIAVEREVDMKVLVMIIMKYGIWLPWLPPISFEVDTRVVDDAVVICV
jgi:hypothetical protein